MDEKIEAGQANRKLCRGSLSASILNVVTIDQKHWAAAIYQPPDDARKDGLRKAILVRREEFDGRVEALII
jgi:hypothetical protein